MPISSKPRVLFSNPPWWVSGNVAGVRAGSRWPFTYAGRSTPGRYVHGDYIPYPFFMGHGASYLKEKGIANVSFRDSIALREDYSSYFAYLDRVQPDFIVIESASPSWEHDAQLIADMQERLPRVAIILTGPIATQGERFEVHVDAVVKGEYEKGVARVIAGERGVIDFDLLSRDEMNAAPFPWQDYATWNRYWDANPRGQIAPQLQAWSSRGCPYKCIFCVWPAAMTGSDPDGTGKRSVRHYGADYMRGFLHEALGRFPFKSVYFDDDTFNLGDKHVWEMCEVMEPLALPWSAMCRADTIRQDTWRRMKEAGCFGVKIGFESGNQDVLDRIVNKRLNLEKAFDAVLYLKKALGMTVHGTFTYGLPGETREQMEDTRRFIRRLLDIGMDTYQESGCAEIEGAPLRTLAERGELRAFPGARVDAEYTRESNGAEKFRILQEVECAR